MSKESARFFTSQLNLDEMLHELRLVNPNWQKRYNEQFGEYLVGHPNPDCSRVRIAAQDDGFVLEVFCDSDDSEIGEYVTAVLINLLLPAVRAKSISETDTLD